MLRAPERECHGLRQLVSMFREICFSGAGIDGARLAARPFPSCVQNRYPSARDEGRGPRFPRASRANRYSRAEVEAGLIVLSLRRQ
jgi:hypothetical protein